MGTSVDKDRLIFFCEGEEDCEERMIVIRWWVVEEEEEEEVNVCSICAKTEDPVEEEFFRIQIWQFEYLRGGKIGRSREKEDRDRLGEKEDSWKRRVRWEKEKLWSSVENPWKKREDIEEERICWREAKHLYNF